MTSRGHFNSLHKNLMSSTKTLRSTKSMSGQINVVSNEVIATLASLSAAEALTIPNIYNNQINQINQITVKERNQIKKLSMKMEIKQDSSKLRIKEEMDAFKTLKPNTSHPRNLKQLKKLVLTSPYQNIPKSVMFSPISERELEKKYIPTIRESCKNKEGNQYKHVSHGSSTIYLKKDSHKLNLLQKLLLLGESDNTLTFKKSIKWKNLKWLLTYKTIYVDLLIDSYKEMEGLLKTRKGKISRNVFFEIMTLISKKRMRNDKQFSETVFLIFDDDRDGFIYFNEMIVGLIFFRNDYFSSKLILLTDICLENNKVDVSEFFRLVRLYIFNKKDIKRLNELLKSALNLDDEGLVNRKSFFDFVINSDEIKLIFGRCMENVTEQETYLEDEISNFCQSNLKRSQMDSNHLFSGMCPREYDRFDDLLGTTQKCADERLKNYKFGLIEHDSSDEEK